MEKKTIWYDARDLKNRDTTLSLICNLRYTHIIINRQMLSELRLPGRMNIILEMNKSEELDEAIPSKVLILSKDISILEKAHSKGFKTVLYECIYNKESMECASQYRYVIDYLFVEIASDSNIPLELLIAKLQGKGVRLLKAVKSHQDTEIAFGVMEVGSDGVVLQTEDLNEITKVDAYMDKASMGKLDLVKGKVIEVQHIGMGRRICIDTTTILNQNEGMLIGSTSQGGILVSSETHFLPYMDLRPFRVNAGAVHSYIWIPEGNTAYLTELKAGSRVLCVDVEGRTREVSVGRVKNEVRPLLKIEAEAKGVRVNVIVQDDWHIRIFGGDGEVKNASNIKIGDELLTYICEGGRHVGLKIDETLCER